MADLVVVYWRDVPAQVIARAGRRNRVTVDLGPRFAEAISVAAMRGGGRDGGQPDNDWRKAAPIQISDDLIAEADDMARWLDEQYDDARLDALVRNGGRDV